jgi:hypothetical protein
MASLHSLDLHLPAADGHKMAGMLGLRRLAWLLLMLTLVLLARPAAAAPGFTSTCAGVMPKEQVDELVELVRGSTGACTLVRVDTQLFRTRIEWSREGVRHEVLLAPSGCVVEPTREGTNLAMHAPVELADACPDALAALHAFVGEPREVAPLAPGHAPWSEASDELPTEPRMLAGLLASVALLVGAAWLIGGWRSRAPPEPAHDALARAWRRLALLGFGVGLLARFAVEPSLGNWYGAFLPVEGWGDQRFGATAALVQASVRALLPWTVELAFGLFRVVGALAVPLTILLVRRLGGSLAAAAIAGLLIALEPIPVRLSASSSEHVIAASLALAAWLCWQTTASERGWAPRVLALALAGLAVLTRVDCLPQLLVLPVMTLVGQPLVEPAAWLPLRRRLVDALAFMLGLAAIGVFAWLRVVLPSNHPGPNAAGITDTIDLLFVQFWVIAAAPPHWLTWSGLVIAALGCVALVALERARLLAAIGLALPLMFVPLGRNLAHDGLTGARYFVLLMPLLGVLAAASVEWITCWIPSERRRAVGLAGALGFAGVELLAARSGWRHEYTFQAEYRVLAAALAERGAALEGCTLWFVRPRQPTGEPDLDCCLWPASSPLQLVAPGLRMRPMPSGREPSDADGCQLYYEGSVCALAPELVDQSPQASARILEQCEALRRREGELVVETGVTDQTLNPRFRGRPWIRLRARGL